MQQAADTPRHPASLTKMMTLYVLFGYMKAGKLTPSSDLTVTQHAASQAPTKLGLKPGATIKVSDAIKALVTQSANDAAATIAENLGGTEENFARLMTDTGAAHRHDAIHSSATPRACPTTSRSRRRATWPSSRRI